MFHGRKHYLLVDTSQLDIVGQHSGLVLNLGINFQVILKVTVVEYPHLHLLTKKLKVGIMITISGM